MEDRLQILVVEDNKADQVLLQECLKLTTCPLMFHFVNDGVEATEFLACRGRYQNKPRPNGILLDLNLPKKDGRELLHEIKISPTLKDIPVIVMSTSNSPEDMTKTYALGACRYVVKPTEFQSYIDLMSDIVSLCG